MGFIKCPRCELNYIQESEQYCLVCKREMKGDVKDDPFEMCSVCNENPVLPGKDICLFCLKELGKQAQADGDDDTTEVTDAANLEMDSVSTMDEIDLDVESDITDPELGEIDRELSLEEKAEEEEEEADREDQDEDDF